MGEPLSEEQKSALVSGYTGDVQQQNKDLFGKKPKVKPTQFSRLPVVPKKTGVYKPGNWFAKGRADKGAEEERSQSSGGEDG